MQNNSLLLFLKNSSHLSQWDASRVHGTQSLQSYLTLSESVDHGLPGSSVHGILQARIVGWVAMPSSRGSSHPGIEPTSPASPAFQADSLATEPPGKSEAFSIASCLFSWLCSPPFHLPQLLLFSRPYTNYTLSSQSLSLYHWDYSRMIFSSPLMDIAFSITLVS